MRCWCYVTLTGNLQKTICVIAAYRVINNPTSSDMTYQQQLRILTQQERTDDNMEVEINLQEYWDKDFKQFLSNIPENENIILGIDANTTLDDPKMLNIIQINDLRDVLSIKHKDPTPPTYVRGTKTIDHILLTQQLPATATFSGILSAQQNFQSEHSGLYIDFNNYQVFGGLHYLGIAKRARKITLKNLVHMINYKHSASDVLKTKLSLIS